MQLHSTLMELKKSKTFHKGRQGRQMNADLMDFKTENKREKRG